MLFSGGLGELVLGWDIRTNKTAHSVLQPGRVGGMRYLFDKDLLITGTYFGNNQINAFDLRNYQQVLFKIDV